MTVLDVSCPAQPTIVALNVRGLAIQEKHVCDSSLKKYTNGDIPWTKALDPQLHTPFRAGADEAAIGEASPDHCPTKEHLAWSSSGA